jgi:UDP-N-acetylmuramyl pentapeptide synthase
MDKLGSSLGAYVGPGDLVLVKGSRGCEMERLDPVLLEKTERGEKKCS